MTTQLFFYILFDDDWIEPTLIQTAIHLFNIYHNISFVEFNCFNHLQENVTTQYTPFYDRLTSIDFYVSNYWEELNIIKTCQSPSNRVFRNLKIFFSETTLGHLDDLCLQRGSGFDFYFIYQHLLIIQQFYYCKEPLVHFNSHKDSCSILHSSYVNEKACYIMNYCKQDYLQQKNKI